MAAAAEAGKVAVEVGTVAGVEVVDVEDSGVAVAVKDWRTCRFQASRMACAGRHIATATTGPPDRTLGLCRSKMFGSSGRLCGGRRNLLPQRRVSQRDFRVAVGS